MSGVGQETDAPWYMKYGARGIGCAGGILAMGLGFLNCLTFDSMCLVAGIYQIFTGFIVVSAEAPCCCMFVDFVQRYSKFVEERPNWQKAALYVTLAIPAIIMCQSLSIFFGSGFIFLTGVLYGMMALGKKGNRNDMLATAQATSPAGQSTMKSTLVNMEAPVATS